MAEANDTIGILYQNLLDAGCDQATVQFCMDQAMKGSCFAMLPRLTQHRVSLLRRIRAKQKQLDHLDYLLYKLNKNRRNET